MPASSFGRTFSTILPAAFAWMLLIIATGLFFAFPCLYFLKNYHIAIPIVQGVITFFVLLNFSMATFMDPGIFPKALPDERKSVKLQPLFIEVEINSVKLSLKWCVTCQFYRPPRCTHCGICDSCIDRFDHHCPWVNNCIGRRNYRYFFMFLIWLSIHMITIFVLCVFYVLRHLSATSDLTTVITLVIMAIIIVLIIPVLGLAIFHMMLIIRGRTTNEQVTGKFYGLTNPYPKSTENIGRVLCSSPYPSFKEYCDLEAAFPDQYADGGGSSSYSAINNATNSVHSLEQRVPCDSSVPHASHSRDCEPSPPPYKVNRNNMFLNLSNSSQHIRNLRAITPPVMGDGRRRHFDSSRRSLPPQHRLHSANQHHATDHTISDPGNLKNIHYSVGHDFPQPNMCNITLPLYSSVTALRPHEYGDPKHSINSISNSVAEMSMFSPNRFTDIKISIDRSETCCLGNQTVEKLQEIANKNSVTEAFNRKCGNFNGTYENTPHENTHFSSTHLSPVTVIGNTCVDCQRTSTSPCSSLASMEQIMSNDLSRMPGRRPLSFVKAMEMSDTLEPMCSERSYLKNALVPLYQQKNMSQSEEYNLDTSGQEVSYEIRV